MNALLATGLTESITSTSRGPLKIQSNHTQHASGKKRSINTPYELRNNVFLHAPLYQEVSRAARYTPSLQDGIGHWLVF